MGKYWKWLNIEIFMWLKLQVRELAYQLAVKCEYKYPKTWDESSKAEVDRFSAYMKRNPTLSIRSPEATSLARATSFNKHSVAMFFRKLDEIIRRHSLTAKDIWNVDETGITTVQTAVGVIVKHVKPLNRLGQWHQEKGVNWSLSHLQSMPLATQFLQYLYSNAFIMQTTLYEMGR